MRIAIDGTAAAGKGTLAKKIAEVLAYPYIDTGALYRGVALISKQRGVAWDDEPSLTALTKILEFSFVTSEVGFQLFCAGTDISKAIRTDDISEGASLVSSCVGVRSALLQLQKDLAKQENVIMDGRDIGTVIMPDAEIKFYVDAKVEVRAQRRLAQMRAKGIDIEFDEVLASLKQRDILDKTREHAPLMKAEDAILLDTSSSSIDESLSKMLGYIQRTS
ncbi:MAG: cytidylate kinase [Deltaproteobacteria bacterium]|nr:cytidylate kinase [Deltaproteobacteria bacterium]